MRFLLCSLTFGVMVAGCRQPVEVAEPKEPVDPLVRAQALAQECMVCHGTKEAQRGPILNGMETWYLTDQLEKFRAGIRGKRASNRSEYLMGIGVQKIRSDYELAYLADWFAGKIRSRRSHGQGRLGKRKEVLRATLRFMSWGERGGQSFGSRTFFATVGGVVFFGTNEKIQIGRTGLSSVGRGGEGDGRRVQGSFDGYHARRRGVLRGDLRARGGSFQSRQVRTRISVKPPLKPF